MAERRARTGGIRDHGIRSSTAQKRETVLLAENLPGIFPGGDEEEALIDVRKPESNGTVGGAEASASNAETATASNSAAFDFQETEASDEAEEVSIQWILKLAISAA